jgi:hypothetical protein
MATILIHPALQARADSAVICTSWQAAVKVAFRTGNAPIRLNGLWYVREAA